MSEVSPPEATNGAPKRRADVPKKRTVGRVILVSLVVLAMVTGLGVVYLYVRLNNNIDTTSLGGLKDRPEKVYTGNGKPLNILVMGDDTRAGDNKIDQETGAGSDTTILVHLSADRTRSYAVSIPRDSIVDRPECGDSPAATDVMWNVAFREGGELCTIAQVESTTDVYVDHFVTVDFSGFGDMVDAVGGVPVCVPEDIDDPKHGIFVPAGDPSVLTGDEALDYVRARYVGELAQQNDLSRIKRQQTFIAALIREVKSAGTLTRLDRVVNFLDAATQSLRTDDELGSVTRLGKLAMQMQDVGLENIQFVTVPTQYFPLDSEFKGKVFWTEDAERIWEAIREDEVLPRRLLSDSITALPPETSQESQTVAPEPTGSPTDPEASETTTPEPTASESPSESTNESTSEAPSPSKKPTPKESTPGVCA